MPKFFDFPVEYYYPGIVRMNEDEWFKCHQPLLLQIANTSEGRDLLCIDKDLPKIVEVGKSYVVGYRGQDSHGHHFVHDFRIGAKWANVIRYRWNDFRVLAKSFYEKRHNGQTLYMPNFLLDGQLVASRATDTFFPDLDPENATFDGFVGRDNTNETLSVIRSGAGNISDDSDTSAQCLRLDASTTTDQYDDLYRGIFLFDTSSLDDTATIDSATFSLFITTALNQFATPTKFNVVSANPASNTALADSDFDINDFGSTRFITEFGIDTITTSQYTDMSLNADGRNAVSTTGITKLGTRSDADIDNSFTWASGDIDAVLCSTAETTDTDEDPKLVVESTVATFLPQIIN